MPSKNRPKGPPSKLRRLYVPLLLALALLGLSLPAVGARKSNAKKSVQEDAGYVAALNAANRFLHAWQSGDLEAGMVLLSDRARHAQNPERFEDFFAPGTERGYEISRGMGSRAHYRFPVALVSTQGPRVRRRFSEVVVVNTGRNDWAVDKLP